MKRAADDSTEEIKTGPVVVIFLETTLTLLDSIRFYWRHFE